VPVFQVLTGFSGAGERKEAFASESAGEWLAVRRAVEPLWRAGSAVLFHLYARERVRFVVADPFKVQRVRALVATRRFRPADPWAAIGG
jgi:hypothetical protein